MQIITNPKSTRACVLMRIVLALLVGLMIISAAAGNSRMPEVDARAGIERQQPVPADDVVERCGNKPTLRYLPEGADDPDAALEHQRPSPHDIWIDVRLLAVVSRVA